MEKFNIERAKAGEPICTHTGRRARLLSTKLKNRFNNVVAVEINPGIEDTYHYDDLGNVDGSCFDDVENMTLYMVNPKKKEETSNHSGKWVNLMNGFNCDRKIYDTKEEAEQGKSNPAMVTLQLREG